MVASRRTRTDDGRTREEADAAFGERLTDWSDSPPKKVVPAQCPTCLHLRSGVLWTCDAFPDGIPAEILTNRFDHTRPHPNDNGIQYEPEE